MVLEFFMAMNVKTLFFFMGRRRVLYTVTKVLKEHGASIFKAYDLYQITRRHIQNPQN
jgi:hypothetical protein